MEYDVSCRPHALAPASFPRRTYSRDLNPLFLYGFIFNSKWMCAFDFSVQRSVVSVYFCIRTWCSVIVTFIWPKPKELPKIYVFSYCSRIIEVFCIVRILTLLLTNWLTHFLNWYITMKSFPVFGSINLIVNKIPWSQTFRIKQWNKNK